MSQSLVEGDPLARVEHENFVQKVFELVHFTGLVLRKLLVAYKLSLEVPAGRYG